MSVGPEITVVICTRNRARYLEPCVASVLDQTLPRERYEIVVVDNGSTDRTSDLGRSWEASGAARYVREPVVGLSQARNTGWRAARGRWVGYLDDDGRATRDWLASAVGAFLNVLPEPGWVGGPIDLDWESAPPAWLDDELQECLGRLDWGSEARWLGPSERLGGGNSFYPRAVLAALGGFDTRLGRKSNLLLSGEETQLQRRLEAAGGRLYYHPGVRMLHSVPAERLQPAFFYQRYYWGGITDEFIRRTLAGRGASRELPSAQAGRGDAGGSLAGRALRSALRASGWGSPGERIRGRIYWSYVAGRLAGAWRWATDPAMRASARESLAP